MSRSRIRYNNARHTAKLGLVSLTALALAAGLAVNANAATTLHWAAPSTTNPAPPAAGAGDNPYILTGNWWDGVVTNPGDSQYWTTTNNISILTTPGSLAWTQGDNVYFTNYGGTGNYQANLTLYGNVQVNQFSGNGVSTKVTVDANSASDFLVIGSAGFDIQTIITFNTKVVLGANDVTFLGYQAVYNGAIGDGGNNYGLHVKGSGTSLNAQYFNGINTYTGATTIESGTMALGSAGSIAASSGVNMTAAGTWTSNGNPLAVFDTSSQDGASIQGLSGTGVVKAASDNGGGGLIVTDHLTPGTASSTSTLALEGGDLTLGNGATYNYLIDGSGGPLATDLVDISGTRLNSSSATVVSNASGTVTFAGNWTVDLSTLGVVDPVGQTYVLFQLGNTDTVNLGTWAINYGTTGWTGGTITQNGNQIVLSNLIVPEPASLALLGLGGLLVWPRRKRQMNG